MKTIRKIALAALAVNSLAIAVTAVGFLFGIKMAFAFVGVVLCWLATYFSK